MSVFNSLQFHWFKKWMWRFTKAALVFILLALGYIAIRLTLLGLNGRQEWKEAVARFEAEAGSLSPSKHVLPPVPDEDNFCANSVLKDIAQVVDGNPDKGEPGERRRRFTGFEKQSLRGLARPASGSIESGMEYGIPWDATDWATHFVELHPELKNKNLSDVELIIEAQRQASSWVDEVVPDLGKRWARFTPHQNKRFNSGSLSEFWIPDSGWLQPARWNLTVNAAAYSRGQRTEEAIHRIQCLCRLSEACQAEGGTLAVVSGGSFARSAAVAVWHLLQSNHPNDEQLANVARCLDLADQTVQLQRHLVVEASAMMRMVDWIEHHPDPSAVVSCCLTGNDMTFRRVDRDLCLVLVRLWPESAWLSLRAHLLNSYLQHFILPLKQKGLGEMSRSIQKYRDEAEDRAMHGGVLDHAGIVFFESEFTLLGERVIANESRLRQAQIAVALERWFVKQGSYPNELQVLVPEFIAAVPFDPIDGQPMRYKKRADRYQLWSVGFDHEDDGGVVIPTKRDNPAAPRLDTKDYPGDWVWSYERLVPKDEQ